MDSMSYWKHQRKEMDRATQHSLGIDRSLGAGVAECRL
jgi:hypothetical protein